MIPWTLLDSTPLPGSPHELRLYQRDTEFSIQVGHEELMNSRAHGSEEALAELTCSRIQGVLKPSVLVGGLGMGFTLAAALKGLYPEARVVVAELLPAVVRWNQGPLAHLAGSPLSDLRVSVEEKDVAKLIKADQQAYDAILLDIDNGPTALTQTPNTWLYSLNGLKVVFAALRHGGVLGVWSAGPDPEFARNLGKAGFIVEEHRVKSRGSKGSSHVIFLAQRPAKGMRAPKPGAAARHQATRSQDGPRSRSERAGGAPGRLGGGAPPSRRPR
ncbi:MAG: hypothetical protein ACO1RX_05890 [Candidatus Sericytochromatia bacterium]